MANQRAWEYMVTSIDIFASARSFGGVSLKDSVGFFGKDAGAPDFDDPQGSSVLAMIFLFPPFLFQRFPCL